MIDFMKGMYVYLEFRVGRACQPSSKDPNSTPILDIAHSFRHKLVSTEGCRFGASCRVVSISNRYG